MTFTCTLPGNGNSSFLSILYIIFQLKNPYKYLLDQRFTTLAVFESLIKLSIPGPVPGYSGFMFYGMFSGGIVIIIATSVNSTMQSGLGTTLRPWLWGAEKPLDNFASSTGEKRYSSKVSFRLPHILWHLYEPHDLWDLFAYACYSIYNKWN